jgi:hypothetical protein
MKSAFVLRFEESVSGAAGCEASHSAPLVVQGGTATMTKVQTESADLDPTARSFMALAARPATIGLRKPTMGTETLTEVRREAADRDPAAFSFAVFPHNG